MLWRDAQRLNIRSVFRHESDYWNVNLTVFKKCFLLVRTLHWRHLYTDLGVTSRTTQNGVIELFLIDDTRAFSLVWNDYCNHKVPANVKTS